MPRQQRRAAPTPARSAPVRPTAAPARPAATPQQQAPHSTAAQPQQHQQAPPPMQAPPQQSAGPGLFGQMASTAAGVAVGSSIGHAIGGLFSGGSSSAPAETQQAPPAQSQAMDNGLWQSSATNQSWENPACEPNVRDFRNCMDENQGNISICGWYLDQLKACQAAAKQY
ncbi:uncharacterized protein N7483_007741 [Penicillium malachiteum]|uniref:uncharacterized protein n=1 Tax=Penicillium malachiteum TaxID=1324776 RepID=UPI002547F23D|nr:uncharacterized protein N7483_007741 [Penicillium malachiteum]KAJ5726384.1 hypothetical protein N7483_007741 [Penicillium malachiteum]